MNKSLVFKTKPLSYQGYIFMHFHPSLLATVTALLSLGLCSSPIPSSDEPSVIPNGARIEPSVNVANVEVTHNVAIPFEASDDASSEASNDLPSDDAPVPVDATTDIATNGRANEPADLATDAPADATIDAPVDATIDTPVDVTIETPIVSVQTGPVRNSNVPQLQDLACKVVGIPGIFYKIHPFRIDGTALPVRAHVFSTLMTFLFGIKRKVREDNSVIFIFEEKDMHGLEDVWMNLKMQRKNFFTAPSFDFLKWAESTFPYFWSLESVRQKVSSVKRGPIEPLEGEEPCEFIRRLNLRTAVDIKNLFPKETKEDLEFSYLALASFFLNNSEIERLESKRFSCSAILRYAFALSLFRQTRTVLYREIERAIEEYHLIPQASTPEFNDFLNILNMLSIVGVSQHRGFARKLIRKVDASKVDPSWKAWLMLQFGTNRNVSFLLEALDEEGWQIPAQVPESDTLISLNFNSLTEFSSPYTNDRIDVYPINLEETYDSMEALEAVCMRDLPNTPISYQPAAQMVGIIVPTGSKVTPQMVRLLIKWGSNADMSEEEDRLARLIILIDQMIVVKALPA